MNLILESPSSMAFFTDMGATLDAIGVSTVDFDWYVSDIEVNFNVPGLSESDGWMTGDELDAVLAHVGLQFIWGVFSAFPRGIRVDVIGPPFVDGNSAYWRDDGTLSPQLNGAAFEVACWDSGATIFVGITPEQAARFIHAHPEAKTLHPGTVCTCSFAPSGQDIEQH